MYPLVIPRHLPLPWENHAFEIILGYPHVGRIMASRRHWQVQAIEIVHREALKFFAAQNVQPRKDLVFFKSFQSAHALSRNW